MRQTYEPESVEFWEKYFLQKGGGYYSGIPYQRGAGIGSFFSSLFRQALPILSRVGSIVAPQVLKPAMGFLGDVLEGKNVGAAAKQRVREGASNLLHRGAEFVQTGHGRKRKRCCQAGRGLGEREALRAKSIKRTKKTKNKDIFA